MNGHQIIISEKLSIERTSQSREERNSGTPREFLRFREGVVDSYSSRGSAGILILGSEGKFIRRAGPGSIRNYRTKRILRRWRRFIHRADPGPSFISITKKMLSARAYLR
jgi:hypothetical protein